jgi:hypothetical protein
MTTLVPNQRRPWATLSSSADRDRRLLLTDRHPNLGLGDRISPGPSDGT